MGIQERKVVNPECISAETARARSSGAVCRPQAFLGPALGHGFGDGQRVPYSKVIKLEYRHTPCRRKRRYFSLRVRRIQSDPMLFKGYTRLPEQQPGAQRPGGIVLVTDN